MQIAAVFLFAEMCLTHAAHLLPRGPVALSSMKDVCEMSHILNWLLYVTVPVLLEVMKACNLIDFSGGECCQGWGAQGASGSSLLRDEVTWQAASVVFYVKESGDPCSEVPEVICFWTFSAL